MSDVSFIHMYIMHMAQKKQNKKFSFNSELYAQRPHVLSVTCLSLWVHAGSFFLNAKCFWRKEFRLGKLCEKNFTVS